MYLNRRCALLCYFIWSRDKPLIVILSFGENVYCRYQTCGVVLVYFLDRFYFILFIYLIFYLIFRSSIASPQKLSPPISWSFIFLGGWNSQQNVGQKKGGGFDVKENYFYKCGNKSLSFNHVAALKYVGKRKCHERCQVGINTWIHVDWTAATPESRVQPISSCNMLRPCTAAVCAHVVASYYQVFPLFCPPTVHIIVLVLKQLISG